jgi:hypothetical protein
MVYKMYSYTIMIWQCVVPREAGSEGQFGCAWGVWDSVDAIKGVLGGEGAGRLVIRNVILPFLP